MNLNSNPTYEQLAELFAKCDDKNSSHILWVDEDGEVRITPLPYGEAPVSFVETLPRLRFRYETFHAGNEYVGEAAAEDEEHVTDYLVYLVRDWREGLRGYSDDFAIR